MYRTVAYWLTSVGTQLQALISMRPRGRENINIAAYLPSASIQRALLLFLFVCEGTSVSTLKIAAWE